MATESVGNEGLYEQVDSYDWDSDQEFQGGLNAILGSANSPEQIARLTLRARCFYYSRKFGTKVDFDGYQAWKSSPASTTNGTGQAVSIPQMENTQSDMPAPQPAPSSGGAHGNAPTPASFAEICQLIAEGKPIPGIKEIPETVLEGQATASTAPRRKKPWERVAPPAEPSNSEVLSQPTTSG
ncbi:hypothetical protein C1H76_1538 [Elsinoe australis]|uniref:Uncharacterized protein n=1 Tax=Elsinoe australis TaxID=40998 RepID=A0A4U7B8L7_9PEZI|nr:hypothetical protein C1H76_1538 [Elsinoe australis]